MITWEYLAGLFDGEGHVASVRGPDGLFHTYLFIGQSGEVGRALCIAIRDFTGAGLVSGAQPSNPKAQYSNWWRTSNSRDTKRVLEGLIPHLIVKRAQALLALELVTEIVQRDAWRMTPEAKARREEIGVLLRAAHRKGPSNPW